MFFRSGQASVRVFNIRYVVPVRVMVWGSFYIRHGLKLGSGYLSCFGSVGSGVSGFS
ncbi:hypothetical protein Hanom_Chr08g00740591 [Helianthus anomalus]